MKRALSILLLAVALPVAARHPEPHAYDGRLATGPAHVSLPSALVHDRDHWYRIERLEHRRYSAGTAWDYTPGARWEVPATVMRDDSPSISWDATVGSAWGYSGRVGW